MGGPGSGRKANGILESQGKTRMSNLLPKAIDNVKDEIGGKQLHPQVHASSWKVIYQNLGQPPQGIKMSGDSEEPLIFRVEYVRKEKDGQKGTGEDKETATEGA